MTMKPIFPPLFSGLSTEDDPFIFAQSRAAKGCDAGLVAHNLQPHTMQAAIVLAPDVALRDAVLMQPIAGIGFQNALGALSPPEVAVHLDWHGGIWVNGGSCGALRIASDTNDPDAIPDWLVIGLTLAIWPPSDNPGETPDQTALYSEGCSDVDAVALLEAWIRHTLVWINRWTEEGIEPIHSEWIGLVHGLDTEAQVDHHKGIFIGVDEGLGMLLKTNETTQLIPLTKLLVESDT